MGWRGALLLGLMTLGLYAILPRIIANVCPPGCAGLRVEVTGEGGGKWTAPNSLSHPGCTNSFPNNTVTNSTCATISCGTRVKIDGWMTVSNNTPEPVFDVRVLVEPEGALEFRLVTNTPFSYNGSPSYREYEVLILDPEIDSKATVMATISGIDYATGESNSLYLEAQLKYEGGGCGSCGSASGDGGFSTGDILNHEGLWFDLDLGHASLRECAGSLALVAATPSAGLSKPTALRCPSPGSNVEVKTNSAGLKQVKVPSGLVNIEVKDDFEYHLQCFYAANVTGTNSSGFYETNAPAFATWIVRNPDTSNANNRLVIKENRNGVEREFLYTHTSQTLRWDLTKPDGQVVSSWREAGPSGNTNFHQQVSVGSAVLRKNQKTRQYVPATGQSLLLREIEGDGALTNTTTYTYYTSGPGSNQVQRIDYPDGRWEYFAYDSAGRRATNYSAYNNSPPPDSDPPNPLSLGCKVTEFAYSLNLTEDGTVDDGSQRPGIPSRTVVKIPAGGALREISRSYNLSVLPLGLDSYSTMTLSTETVVECATPGSGVSASGNLTNTTYRHNTTDYQAGRLWLVERPDSSSTVYDYPDEFTTTVTDSGAATTITTTVVNDWGKPVSLVKTRNGVTIENKAWAYSGNLLQSYTLTDNLSGRTTQYQYAAAATSKAPPIRMGR